MARRFGGEFSPDGQNAHPGASGASGGSGASGPSAPAGSYLGAHRSRVGGRVNALFLLPLPLIWRAFTSDAVGLAMNLGALGLMLLAAWLTREGLRAQEAYEARKVARRPAFPRKIAGGVLLGAGLALTAWAAGGGAVAPVILGGLGVALHLLSFGLDPMSDKGMGGLDGFQSDRVTRVVDQAETYLKAMRDEVSRAGDREAEARVDTFETVVRNMLRTVEDDPRDLTAARRYLGVYLMGARDATTAFADVYARTRDPRARGDYLSLLADLEKNFTAQTQKLLSNNSADLEIEIGVLRDRLAREGIRIDTGSS